MRFTQILLLLLTICVSSCTGDWQRPKSESIEAVSSTVNGKAIHSITSYYQGHDGSVKRTEVYNTKGQEVLSLDFDEKGNCDSKDTFLYDSQGDKVCKIWYLSGKFISKIIYKYDDEHQVIRSEEFLTTLPDSTWNIIYTYKYDSKGQVIDEVMKQGNIYRHTVRRFNDHGKIILSQSSFNHEKLHYTEVFVYDAQGSLVMTKCVPKPGDTQYVETSSSKICEHKMVSTKQEVTYY